MKIYVASSWRNPHQPGVVAALREDGHEVYDFRAPSPTEHGFSWCEIGTGWETWTAEEYVGALEHPVAEHGFSLDFDAMKWCDVCVMVLPCGASAHTEAGWCKGAGKKTAVLIFDRHPSVEVLLDAGHTFSRLVCRACHVVGAAGTWPPCKFANMTERTLRGWEPELMYKMHDLITPSLEEIRRWLSVLDGQRDATIALIEDQFGGQT